MIKNKVLLLAGALMILPYAQNHCQTAATLLAQIPPTGGTISESGSYYLGFDVTGDIAITASDVTLDLNGHLVTGSISVSMTLSNVAIMNGFVTVTAVGTPISVATGCNNLHLSNITIRQAGLINGITITDGTNVMIKEVVCLSSATTTGVGLMLTGCSGVMVSNCLFNGWSNGFVVTGASDNIVLTECSSNNNNLNGFQVAGGTEITFLNCIAFSNASGNDGAGFRLTGDNAQCQAFNCIADNNESVMGLAWGYFAEGVTDGHMHLTECLAYKNRSGFAISNINENVVQECVAIENLTDGFTDFGASDLAHYVANYSDANPTNYSPAGTPFVSISANDLTAPRAQFWRNTIKGASGNDC